MNPKDLETRNCKTANCDRIANTKYKRGPYSGLCEEVCIPAKRDEMSRLQRESHAARSGMPPAVAPPKPAALSDTQPTSFEAKAKRLVGVGKKLDQAVARFKPAKATLEQAMREWKAEVARLAGDET